MLAVNFIMAFSDVIGASLESVIYVLYFSAGVYVVYSVIIGVIEDDE